VKETSRVAEYHGGVDMNQTAKRRSLRSSTGKWNRHEPATSTQMSALREATTGFHRIAGVIER